ncbi:MAG: hypothetical protein Q9M19_02205 [Mariprofundaceae bacterium]|nr:hypothetical protein [Mariprofundaceae bacterium]
MHTDEEKAERPTKTWNKLEKKSHGLFYILIGLLCFMIAWAMSGAV